MSNKNNYNNDMENSSRNCKNMDQQNNSQNSSQKSMLRYFPVLPS